MARCEREAARQDEASGPTWISRAEGSVANMELPASLDRCLLKAAVPDVVGRKLVKRDFDWRLP